MNTFRFINRQTGKRIIIAANNFSQAVNDLYTILGDGANNFRFLELLNK